MDIKYEELTLLKIMRDNKLLPLQFAVKEKLNNNNYTFVFDEVGCGKTIEAGICIWDVIMQGGKNVLIVTPSNLTFNWYSELLTKFGLDFKVIGGTQDAVDLYYSDNFSEDVTNFCIASYDSRGTDKSNAAIDRLSKKKILWDLIVLDEGHESKNNFSMRYQALSQYESKKVLFLSATPIKNLQEDFSNEYELVKKLIRFSKNIVIDPNKAISFDLTYPISRNFKEIITNAGCFKQRIVSEIDYEISDEIISKLPYDGLAFDQKRNCIMLFENYLRDSFKEVFACYHKNRFSNQDVEILRNFDTKMNSLLNIIDEIDLNDRIVIFCNHIEVVNYLKKIFVSLYGAELIEAIHGESFEQEERKKRLLLLDRTDSEMDKKRIVILSHNIASVGVNLSKFTHLINYELPYTPADLEQRFGRIDRLTNNSNKLMLYFFKDKNGFFDTVYLNRIFTKLTWEVLPILPGKNLITTVTQAVVNRYCEVFKQFLRIEEYLKIISQDDSGSQKEDILRVIKEIFGKNVIETGSQKVLTNNVSEILSKIQEIKEQWKISDNADELVRDVEAHLQSMTNKVFYKQDGKEVSIGYEELKKLVYSEDYKAFKTLIDEKGNHIIEMAKDVADKYKHDKSILIKELRDYLEEKDDVAFTVLYGIYCALKQNGVDVQFGQIMKEYNGEL